MDDQNQLIQQLDLLADFEARLDLIQVDKSAARKTIITPEIEAELEALDAEFAPLEQSVNKKIEAIKDIIKLYAIPTGKSVKGSSKQAVYNRGKLTISDRRAYERYKEEHPEVVAFIREGDPWITFRDVKS